MTMNNTGTLIAASQIIPAIANFYDWNRLYKNAKLFSLMMNLGLASAVVPTGSGGKGNYRAEFNKTTGMKTDYVAAGAAPEAAAGTFDLRTSNLGNNFQLDFSAALALVNISARVGMGIRFIGYGVDGAAATQRFNILMRIEAITGAADWTVKLLQTSLDNTVAYGTFSTLLAAHGGTADPSYYLITDVAEFGGEAPTADDILTSQDYNNIQMYDVSYGKNIVAKSQLLKFDNHMNTLLGAVEPRFMSQINTDLWFGGTVFSPSATLDYGAMKGIWKFLNLDNPALNTDAAAPTVRVDAGTDIDFWNLAATIADRSTDAPEKLLCFTTSTMDIKLLKSAHAVNATVRNETVHFPKMTFNKRSIMVGDTELILIVDDKLNYHPILQNSAGTAAGRGNLCVMIDPRSVKLMYHDNDEYGVMIPSVRKVNNSRDKRVVEDHMISALTLGMWNLHQHIAYGITNA